MSVESVLADYQGKLEQLQVGITHARAAQNVSLIILAAALALTGVLVFLAAERRVPAWFAVLPLPAVAGAGRWYGGNRLRWSRFLRLRGYYERGEARIGNRWAGNGFTGEEFRVEHHVYDGGFAGAWQGFALRAPVHSQNRYRQTSPGGISA